MKEKRRADAKRPPKETTGWTTMEEMALIQLYKAGRPKYMLAESFGRTEYGIQRKLDRLKKQGRIPICPKGRFMKEVELHRIIDLYNQGKNYKEIAPIVDRSERTVWEKLNQYKKQLGKMA
jgi:DNA-binding transcriptional regulator LsrR (DeoR family)